MAIPDNSGLNDANLPKIDEKLTYSVLTSRARRKLLVALANDGPKSGADLRHVGRGFGWGKAQINFTTSTIANLTRMVASGSVLKLDHRTDGRRVLYALSPRVKVTKEGEDTVFDFGFFVARLNADGN